MPLVVLKQTDHCISVRTHCQPVRQLQQPLPWLWLWLPRPPAAAVALLVSSSAELLPPACPSDWQHLQCGTEMRETDIPKPYAIIVYALR